MDGIGLKVELQSLGVRLGAAAEPRLGGAGPAEGLTLGFLGLEATVPVASAFARSSPYSLQGGEDGTLLLCKGGAEPVEAGLPPEPLFYSRETAGGVPLRRVAVRHSRDCIGSTLLQWCSRTPRCAFCAIDQSRERGLTLAEKSPEQLEEAAGAAAEEGFAHAVLTTGTPPGDDGGIPGLAAGAAAMARAGLAVHVQFEPPGRPGALAALEGAAVSAGIHFECFDEAVRKRVSPGKCARSLGDYVAAWKEAVELLGPGRVSSFVIAGLGEEDVSILEGARLLASLGVYPFILPLRPIPGTPLAGAAPPSPDRMRRLYEAAAAIVGAAGLSAADAGAGCVRCGGCSAVTHYTG